MRKVALVLAATLTTPAEAAVRICKGEVSSGLVGAANEQEAKKRALEVWRDKALELGKPFSAWRIAADKLLKCLPAKASGYECIARARPCTIDQAPDKRELRARRLEI